MSSLIVQDTRILLTISNLTSLKKSVVPKIIKQFEVLYGVPTEGDRKVGSLLFLIFRPRFSWC